MSSVFLTNNILISDDVYARITDVGLDLLTRRASFSAVDHLTVPAQWMFKSREELSPPETAISIEHTTAMDVYSFGCIIFSIYTESGPFSSQHYAHCGGLVEIMCHGHSRLRKPVTISEEMWSLIMWCWKLDPVERPAMKELVAELRQLVHM